MTAAKNQRVANLDLLRIISMVLIIFLHSIDHSGVLENAINCTPAVYFYVRLTYAMCQVCVNLYVILSGYFMVHSKFRLHKLVSLWVDAAFYSFVLKLLFMLTGSEPISIISLASCFFPFLTGRYWFLTIYVGMYLISPFLNTFIQAMTKSQHTLLNLCLFLIMSVWVSIHPAIAGMNSGGGWGLAWFVVLYITAAWFRLYYTPNHKPLKWFVLYLIIPLIIALAHCPPLGNFIPRIFHEVARHWYRYDSAPVYIMTLFLFIGFLNIEIKPGFLSKIICKVAPLTLGVYLIHAHANVSPWLWSILALPGKMSSHWFPLVQLGCVIGIFLTCIAVDAARKSTIGRVESSRTLNAFCERITCRLNELIRTNL